MAVDVNVDGHRENLGLDVATAEDGAGLSAFLRPLTSRPRPVPCPTRRLRRPRPHGRRVDAVLPSASWQCCRTHTPAIC
ncbi:hypothetical protein ACFC08_16915 [Streptomyces sp. NPDC056112]|uniref:hypothetical protein n=1 Tax=Streptomyces sp. NPDC056112 TaxID=3345715 RepID=UPI0035D95424